MLLFEGRTVPLTDVFTWIAFDPVLWLLGTTTLISVSLTGTKFEVGSASPPSKTLLTIPGYICVPRIRKTPPPRCTVAGSALVITGAVIVKVLKGGGTAQKPLASVPFTVEADVLNSTSRMSFGVSP